MARKLIRRAGESPPPVTVALVGEGAWVKGELLPMILESSKLVLKAVYAPSSTHEFQALMIAHFITDTIKKVASSSSSGRGGGPSAGGGATSSPSPSIDVYSDEKINQGKGYEDLLKREDVEAVIISLPQTSQPQEHIRLALLSGKTVLSTSPISSDLDSAREFVAWYRSPRQETRIPAQTTWSVAEPGRYLWSYRLAGGVGLDDMGSVIGFHGRQHVSVVSRSSSSSSEEEGGGEEVPMKSGVNFMACLRQILSLADGADEGDTVVESVAAFTNSSSTTSNSNNKEEEDGDGEEEEEEEEGFQVKQKKKQKWLRADVIMRMRNGASGGVHLSVGEGTMWQEGSQLTVECEDSWVRVVEGGGRQGGYETASWEHKGSLGMRDAPSVKGGWVELLESWADGVMVGKGNQDQGPEEALADLELMDLIFRSGMQGGVPLKTEHQTNYGSGMQIA